MLKNRSAWCVGLTTLMLSGCSSNSMHAIREWWNEDLRGPRADEYQEEGSSSYRMARRQDDIARTDDEHQIIEQDVAPPRTLPRASPARAPVARTAKPAARMPKVQPSVLTPAPSPLQVIPAPSLPVRLILPASIVSVAGMTEAAVRGALGAPQDEIDRGLQKIWTYRGEGCVIEVNFFLDVTSNTYAALGHKTLNAEGHTASPRPCFKSTTALSDADQ